LLEDLGTYTHAANAPTQKKVELPVQRGKLKKMGKKSDHRSKRGRTSSRTIGTVAVGALLASSSPISAFAEFQLTDWTLHRAETPGLSLTGGFKYFSTKTNWDGRGSRVAVSGLQSYTRSLASAEALFALHPKLTLFGRTTWNWNSIESATLSARSYGLADQSLGLSLRAIDQSLKLDLQVQADLPAYSNAESAAAGTPFLGDASTDISVGAFLSTLLSNDPSRNWNATAGAGYTFRSASFSSAIPWSATLSSAPGAGRGLTFSAGAAGFQSLRTDPYAATGASASRPNDYSGGSFIINAINPSMVAVRSSVGYQFDNQSQLSVGARKPVWGQAIADGFSMELGFRWSLSSGAAPRRPISPNKLQKSNQLTRYLSEGKVVGVVSTRTLLIDLGSESGMAVGDLVDIFSLTPEGTPGEPVARGQVVHLTWNQAEVNLLEVYQETAIKEGFLARKPIAL